ncbi:hypothetical protein HRG_009565 [Hirsutella rhossiliensis]|uniref:Uncharacterized protein n=1 Tax=Hirsutella rhossiliensis TaxID=111463 RepID=A0A9P8SEK8_9HYPO|nr:uncharacterized protein HRG_09565 [Hirsutella rhossiliensis]KAH0959104.1 hypothetical protein HRG_09565 [Hirsutella rhossiliensis]
MPPAGHAQPARDPRLGGGGMMPPPAMPAHPPPMPNFPPPLNGPQQIPSQGQLRWQPPARHRRYGLQTSDIRNENPTEADARHWLSSFVVIRMEKKDCSNEVDEEGYPLRPTWRRIEAVEETAISQQEATRKARELMKHGPPVGDKKSELGPAVQRQIEVAQWELEEREPDTRYHYVLVQLDSKLRRIQDSSSLRFNFSDKNKKSKKCKCTLVQAKCNCSPLQTKCKCAFVRTRCKCGLERTSHEPKYERVSVTTYFERTPRPNENALAMLQEEQRSKQQSSMPAGPFGSRPLPPQFGQPPTTGMPPFQPPIQPRLPPPPPPPPPAPHQPAGNTGTGDRHRHGNPKAEVTSPTRADVKGFFGSPRDSRSSFSSRDPWESESGGYSTARSSSGSSFRRSFDGKGRSPSRHRIQERQEYFGVEVPRRHSKRDQEYLPAAHPQRVRQGPGLRVLTPATDVGIVRESAYIEDRDGGARLRGLLPKVIQRSPPLFRCLPEHEARRNLFAEDLDQMRYRLYRTRLDDEDRLQRDSRLEQEARHDWLRGDLDRGQRLSDRLQRDSVENLRRVVNHSRESGRRREEPWETGRENPFSRVRRPPPVYESRR